MLSSTCTTGQKPGNCPKDWREKTRVIWAVYVLVNVENFIGGKNNQFGIDESISKEEVVLTIKKKETY